MLGVEDRMRLNFNDIEASNMHNIGYLFNMNTHLEKIDILNFNTKQVTDMSNMLNGCQAWR